MTMRAFPSVPASFIFLALAPMMTVPLPAQSVYATPYTFTTLAGQPGAAGYADGTGTRAHFNQPAGIALGPDGSLYVADLGNSTLRRVSPAGVVTTLAGTPSFLAGAYLSLDGTGAAARFIQPTGVAVDATGNIYVTDSQANQIRKVTPAGVVTTLAGTGIPGGADGPGNSAQFNGPTGIAIDSSGNLYVCDSRDYTVRKITPAGSVSTLAGLAGTSGLNDGTGTGARFNNPTAVVADSSGNIYVADSGNACTIRKITSAGVVTTIVGTAGAIGSADGTGPAAELYPAYGLALDSNGNLFVTQANNTIRKVTPGLVVTTLAGSSNVPGSANGTGAMATFNYPYGVTVDAAGDLYVTDNGNNTVRERYAAAAAPPAVTAAPVSQSAALGATVTLSVTATGVPVPTYQWLFDGSNLQGATNPTLVLTNVQAANLGTYAVIVTNAGGSVTSAAATVSSPGVTPIPPTVTASHLANISSRAMVGTGGDILIAGFVIAGPVNSTEQVLVRGVGLTLGNFGIDSGLPSPVLTVFDGAGNQVATNTLWTTNANVGQITAATSAVGTFALVPPIGTLGDSALLLNLAPGSYTAQVAGAGGANGVALAEVYEVAPSTAHLINISSRAFVGTQANVEIAGLVVEGSEPALVLIRAVGPTLSGFGVTDALAQPSLSVTDAIGNVVATNTGWTTSADAAAIATAAQTADTFPLALGSADSAVLVTLQPGSYTAVVSGAGGTTGVALVEAYQLP